MLPATQLPLRQFPINPLEQFLSCQGCAQINLWADSPRFILGEWEDGGDWGGTLEGSRQRIHVVHSLWNLNTGNSGVSPDGLFFIKICLHKCLCKQHFCRPLTRPYISFITNLSLIFYCYSPKGHFDYYIKGSKKGIKKPPKKWKHKWNI